ncbi:hypothetical protein Dda_6435 [Drechslerella dactyloides]|uniref:ZZ-type domain-containing protein n=1 Tax=Drechslerella dactyloides TaxID=74499 RepID=A0AAD6ITI5_DREDA|nr:hypothetical protein Dda_6435 [Drechslerella dactyloides]
MDPGDINVMWERALAEYEATTKESVKNETSKTVLNRIVTFWNIERPSKPSDEPSKASNDPSTTAAADTDKSLAAFLMSHTGTFNKARKNGTWNAIGHFLAQYTNTAKDLVSIAGTGGSLAFPPAAVIVLVTTHAAGAIAEVTKELDAIEQLFEVMTSFSRRVNLLKDKVPPEPAYQAMVIDVFRNMLAFCGDVSRRAREGLGKVGAFFKALVRGGDPMVKAACDNVLTSIHRLDSATIFQTLANTVDMNMKITSLHAMTQSSFEGLHADFSGLRGELAQNLLSRDREDDRVKRVDQNTTVMLELLLGSKGASTVDTKSQKFRSLEIVTKSLFTGAEKHVVRRLMELEQTRVAGIFDWISNEPAYDELRQSQQNVLCVSGESGMGKSFLAYQIYSGLRAKFEAEHAAVAVAYFAFDSSVRELRTMESMLKFCSVQVAQQSDEYQGYLRELISLKTPIEDDCWFYLFDPGVKKLKAEMKVFIIVDGVDELDEFQRWEFDEIVQYLRHRDSSRSNLQPHLVLVGSLGSWLPNIPKGQFLLLDKERLRKHGDLRLLAEARLDSPRFPKLTRLRPGLRHQIVKTIENNADTFLYIDHMLRRLNAIGSVFLIRKQIERPPYSTDEIYKWLLEECARAHTLKEQEMLGYLFTWLAYSKTPLSLDAAQRLLNIVAKLVSSDTIINIEEEARGRVSKILAILDADAERPDAQDASEEADDHQCSYKNESTHASHDEHEEAFIGFQETSLLEYFRGNASESSKPLRPSKSAARLMLFKMSVAVLTEPAAYGADDAGSSKKELPPHASLARETRPPQFRSFAAKSWRTTLNEIADEWAQLDDDSINRTDLESVVLKLSDLLDGENDGIMILQDANPITHPNVEILENINILAPTQDGQRELLAKMEALAVRARSLGLDESKGRWFEKPPDTETPVTISTSITASLAKRHIKNWLKAQTGDEAYLSSRFAVQALYSLPKDQFSILLKGTTLLEDGVHDPKRPSCEFLEEIVKFGGGGLDPRAYGKISMALYATSVGSIAHGDVNAALKGIEIAKASGDETAFAGDMFMLNYRVGRSWFESLNVQLFDKVVADNYLTHLDRVRRWFVKAVEAAATIPKDSKDYPELKPTINVAYQMLALVQFHFTEHFDDVLGTMRLAEETAAPDTWRRYFNQLVEAFGSAKKWSEIIELTEIIDNPLAEDFRRPLTYTYINRAAKACKREDHVREIYHKAACRPDPQGAEVPATLLRWSIFERFVRADTAAAKTQLYKLLNSQCRTGYLRSAARQLVDIVLEDFRLATTYDGKEAALAEMEKIVEKVKQRHGFEFRPELSVIPLPLATMRRKLGPTRAFHSAFNASFDACIEALQDDSPTNDADSLLVLARLLTFLSDDREDARTAMTCRFYNVTRVSALDGDEFNPGMSCDACRKSITRVDATDKVYTCVTCSDIDLCAACYASITTGESEKDESYVPVCPGGHEYLGYPADDWEGVTGGVLMRGGKGVPFAEWRDGLQEKWKADWEKYCRTQLQP